MFLLLLASGMKVRSKHVYVTEFVPYSPSSNLAECLLRPLSGCEHSLAVDEAVCGKTVIPGVPTQLPTREMENIIENEISMVLASLSAPNCWPCAKINAANGHIGTCLMVRKLVTISN